MGVAHVRDDEWTPFPIRGACPVDDETLVRVRLREWPDRASAPLPASKWKWSKHKGQRGPWPGDIIAYRVEG